MEVAAQPPALDQRRAAAGRALGIDRRRREAGWVEPVVVEDEGRRRNLIAEPLGERRAAALDGVGAERAAKQAGEAGGDGRGENDRATARGWLARADHLGGADGALAPDPHRVEARRAAGEIEAQPRLATALTAGQSRQVGVAARRLVLPAAHSGGGDRDPLAAVRVDRLLDADDPLVGVERGSLYGKRQIGDLRR